MICKNCQKHFIITQEEKEFIEKISPAFNNQKYSIPLPEICPDCRLCNRTAHRNEQYLHQNVSAKSGQPIISLYSPQAECSRGLKLFLAAEEWWRDDWDALTYGRDYDFNRPFFEQFKELSFAVPRQALMQTNNINSPYTTGTGFCKNCHLISCSEYVEDSYYGKLIQSSKDIMDAAFVYDSELCYQAFNVRNCFNCIYVSYSQNCYDCYYCENLTGCKNCIFCTNLVNQEYCYLNNKISKEEFEQKKQEVLASRQQLRKALETWRQIREKRIYKYASIVKCQNSTGDFLINCKNCTDCYDMNDSEDCKYVVVGVNVKDLMDCSNMYLKQELAYQVLGTIDIYDCIFCLYPFYSQHLIYCENCWSSKYLFGCVGLRHKEYCIFNKQYTEEEYNQLVPKIIEQMKRTGEWGKYFPIKNSPLPYNNTVAHDYLPLTADQAKAIGCYWLETGEKEKNEIIYPVPDNINEVKDDILTAVLTCEKCQKNFKIIKQELDRSRHLQMPIPFNCPDCRHWERMSLRNPRRLYDRQCAKCGQAIKSTFAPERKEIIYCEECYQKEIY
jgi:CxxC-x17-CxxC domain-containing protein